ncbi:MAG: hypothetical protein N2691_01370 [Patescibacteria group bacterium]|nr:hypothetical protein [Patescibacteria group bacterium]
MICSTIVLAGYHDYLVAAAFDDPKKTDRGYRLFTRLAIVAQEGV